MGQPAMKSAAESGSTEIQAPEAAAIKAEYSRRWYRQLLISGQILVFAFPVLILGERSGDVPAWAVGMALLSVLVGLAGSFWNWRCPHCSTYFGKKFLGLRFCASCGIELV